VIIRRLKSSGVGSQIANYTNGQINTNPLKVSRNKKPQDKPSTVLEFHDMRNNALTRLKTHGATEALKNNLEGEQILNGN
jgi:hypothetical protein